MGKDHPWQQNIHQIEISDITDILENAETFSYLPQRHVLLLVAFPRQWGSTRQAYGYVNNVFNNSLRREGFFHLMVSHDPAHGPWPPYTWEKHCGSGMHVAEEVFHLMVTRKQRVLGFRHLHRPDLGVLAGCILSCSH